MIDAGRKRMPLKRDVQLNVWNFAAMRAEPPSVFGTIRLDANNSCNVHCVYCHNPRTTDLIELDDLAEYFRRNVLAVTEIQVGCIMEPTIDERLGDLLLLLARGPAPPQQRFVLQTNGILLHRHDPAKIAASGLTHLQVSVDSARAETHRLLRGGTSLAKVLGNIEWFRHACPAVSLVLLTTATRANLAEIEPLAAAAVELGARQLVVREMLHQLESNVVDHARLRELLLPDGALDELARRLRGSVPAALELIIVSRTELAEAAHQTRLESLL